MIAGVDQETTVGLRVAGGEFVFERSRAGDGTVPLELAVLPDVLTYYLAEEHGSLPKERDRSPGGCRHSAQRCDVASVRPLGCNARRCRRARSRKANCARASRRSARGRRG